LVVGFLFEVMADSSQAKSSKTEDFTAKDVDDVDVDTDVDLLNVSFSEMELGKNMNVYLRRHANYMQIYRQI
jgi:hypothetical protein